MLIIKSFPCSALVEQLNTETVTKYVKVVQASNPALIPNLEYQMEELTKLHVEAKDNCRFLTTLERHFKVSRIAHESDE